MNIKFTSNFDLSDELKSLAEKKFSKVVNHFNRITAAHMIFNTQKLEHSVETTLHVPNGGEIFAKGKADDMYKALDEMIEKLDRQIKKHKEKMTDHHRGT